MPSDCSRQPIQPPSHMELPPFQTVGFCPLRDSLGARRLAWSDEHALTTLKLLSIKIAWVERYPTDLRRITGESAAGSGI